MQYHNSFLKILLVLLSFHSTSLWAAKWESETLQPISFTYLEKSPAGDYMTSPTSYKMSQKCYGFTGSCTFNDLGIKLDLSFEGKTIKLPSYSIFNGGFIMMANHFGTRKLVVSKIDGTLLATFTQKLWFDSAYSDFSQVLYFDLSNKRIIVSARDLFSGVQELGYPVSY